MIDFDARDLKKASTLVVRVRHIERAEGRIKRWMWMLRLTARLMGLKTAEPMAVRHLRRNSIGDSLMVREGKVHES